MKKIVLIGLTLLMVGCSSYAQRGAVQLAYSNFNDQDYEDTLAYISQAEHARQMSPELKAELIYLKAQTYEKMGEYTKAKSLYLYLSNEHKLSQYGYLASERLKQIL